MISCLWPRSFQKFDKPSDFSFAQRLSAVEMAVKRKVPVRPERDVPALANVRVFVSRAQENIL